MTSRTILLVEDNPHDEALTLRALKKSGIKNEVVVARDGAEALDYLQCSGAYAGRMEAELPAVVLMDLNLPKLSGLEALKRIRDNPATRLLPVVILTSSDEEEDRLKGYELGANSFVRKPVEFTRFASAVQQLGLYWLLLNEPSPNRDGPIRDGPNRDGPNRDRKVLPHET
jgi:two-component system response regulator